MKVLKFGGSSVATPDAIRRVLDIVTTIDGRAAVVVSAFGGVTDELLGAAEFAAGHDEGYRTALDQLEERHLAAARELATAENDALAETISAHFSDLRDLLQGAYLLRECSLRTRDSIVAYGERLSSEIVAAALRATGAEAEAVDARRLIVTDDSFGRAQVDLETTFANIREYLEATTSLAVFPGFIGATSEGQTTTLGRGGSDYTAALVGAAVRAEAIELWTDVAGVMTADPRQVADAFPQSEMSYAELMELSHFGAKVVYPPTIHPARSRGIPLVIKNTFAPEAPGTRVVEKAPHSEHPIRGISSIHRVVLMRLEGDGMVGVPGIAMRLFGALARRQVSVILISQGSSEHSICFAVAPEHAEPARAAVQDEFALERQAGIVDELILEEDQSVVAAVGESMRHRPGIAGRLFRVLGDHGVNVRAVAQGSSERNISLVIDGADESRALNAVHGGFFHPRRRRVAVALAGPGGVGGALIEQIRAATGDLADEGLEIRVVALANSRRLLLDRNGIDLDHWSARLEDADTPDRERLLAFLGERRGEAKVFVDCTATSDVPALYPEMLRRGVAVVAANKLGFAGPMNTFETLRHTARHEQAPLFFESTVGAGLPVLRTLDGLRRTRHEIRGIDGVLSGTVNTVLDRLRPDVPFSQAVRWAFDHGLTEPNPYEDLSGGDVMRKLAILARMSGRTLETSEIEVEPLLPPEPWGSMDLDTFWEALPEIDGAFARRWRDAADRESRLRYVASLDGIGARVALTAVGPDHPAYGVTGADNLIAFTTQHYSDSPLVLSGPGAGQAVTAAGVFADILEAVERMES